MKLLFDFLPIIFFFLAFKLYGVYIATAVFLVASTLQMLYTYMTTKKVELIQAATFGLGLLMGGATLWFHDADFIKWKPTLVYWLLAVVFALSHFRKQGSLIKQMLGEQLQLQEKYWSQLNWLWVGFFTLLGALNLFVMHQFDTAVWVDFKLFGLMGLTLIFIIIQAFYIQCRAQS